MMTVKGLEITDNCIEVNSTFSLVLIVIIPFPDLSASLTRDLGAKL